MSTRTDTPAGPLDATEKDDAYPAIFHDELGLEEISLVPRGANHGADLLVFKASDTDDPTRSPLQRMRDLTYGVLDRLSSLVMKHDIPADEAAPILASLESAAIIGAVAKDDAPPPADAGTAEAAPAPAPPTNSEGAGMSAPATEPMSTPAPQSATAEAVEKMNTQLAEAVAKAAAAEAANALLAAKVEKMENETRDRELTAKVDVLFAGVPGDKAAFKALVAKCDAADVATLEKLVGYAREVAKSSHLFESAGTVAKSAPGGATQAANAFEAKVDEIRTADRLSYAEATVKAATLYPDLANAVVAEHRATIASTK